MYRIKDERVIQGAVATPLLYLITKYMCDRAFNQQQREDPNNHVRRNEFIVKYTYQTCNTYWRQRKDYK